MGGRGSGSGGRGGRAPTGYRTVKKIGGIRAIKSNTGKGLPSKSSPSSKYYRVDSSGKVSQYREYDKKGNAQKDIDWEHAHNGIPKGTPHTHDWENGKRGDGRRLTPKEQKKYQKRIHKVMEGK